MSATAVFAELRAAGVVLEAVDGQLRLVAPANTLTPAALAAVKSCKAELLEILQNRSLLSNGPGVGGQCAAGVRAAPIETIARTTADGDSYADREWNRFLAVAEPLADGSGWFDPTQEPVPVGGYVPPSSERPAGVPRGWTARSWIGHLRYMGNACAALNPEQSADYLSKAEQLEDHCNV